MAIWIKLDSKGPVFYRQVRMGRNTKDFRIFKFRSMKVHIKGQEDAYKEVIKTAVGGAAGVIHAVDSATTDCQPNANVEALRVFMLNKKIEARPTWKPMHKQPVYAGAPVYTNGVEEDLFKVGFCLPAGPYVSDEDVRYIVECIKEAIIK